MILHRSLSGLVWPAALCAALTLLPPPLYAYADPAADARKMIQAGEDKEDAAVAKKDIEGAFSACAEDFYTVDGKGGVGTLPELKKQLQAVFQSVQAIVVKNTVQKVTLKANKAIVRVAGHTIMTLNGPAGAKPSKAIIDAVTEEHWLKTEGVWLRETAKLLSQTLSKDGKPFAAEQPKPLPKQKQ